MIKSAVNLPVGFNSSLYFVDSDSIEFKYSGEAISMHLNPGRYKFEAYGASGGGTEDVYSSARLTDGSHGCIDNAIVQKYEGNAKCLISGSQPGAGGYASAVISLRHSVHAFVVVGGKGLFSSATSVKGGFNGGGSTVGRNSGSGGGATDFRLFSNDYYHRILVAGGGGGMDDPYGTAFGDNDGSGGSGGFPSQGLWLQGVYKAEYEANTTYGFTFGNGQIADYPSAISDRAGAGGGFFGGFTYPSGNAGGSGGSSFAFTKEIPVPRGVIETKDENGILVSKGKYSFLKSSEYLMKDAEFATGIQVGNGKARITILESYPKEYFHIKKCTCFRNNNHMFSLSMIFIIIS